MAMYKDVEPLDFMNLSNKSDEFCEGVRFALEEIDKLPSADVVEVKHGEWIVVGRTEHEKAILKCSHCGRVRKNHGRSIFCGDCGAKMDGGKAE